MAKAKNPRKRERGTIDELPSGALRVRVYAGQDPVTKRRHDLVEVVPAGPKVWDRAEEVRQGFLADIRKRRNPQTVATVDQLLDRYLEQHTGGRRTIEGYREYVDKHVRPFIGRSKVGAIDAEILDSLYAEMRRCREHCRDRRGVDHRTSYPHECDRDVGRTGADLSGTQRSARFTTSSAVPTSERCAGGGWARVRWTRPSLRRCRRPIRSRRRPRKPPAWSSKPGAVTLTGG
ncbi:MAG TPA: hypothetical protein VNP37_18040, partial [Actinomycetospora sp.]|nr:hypothetical protein [Actinomycetospora sp.]